MLILDVAKRDFKFANHLARLVARPSRRRGSNIVTMLILVTSASGINGNGYGALLAFKRDGTPIGPFNDDSRIADPRGLAMDQKERLLFLNSGGDRVLALGPDGTVVRDTGPIAGLNPGGGIFGPDGRYYVGLRSARTIMAFPVLLDATGENFLPAAIVPFPRGFAFGHDGRLFLASGIGPNGEGDNAILAITPGERTRPFRFVSDPDLSPLDLAIAPNGNVVVSSEHPFGLPDAVTNVREYDAVDGHLVRVFSPTKLAEFRKPRGLRFGPDGHLYCVAQDEVVAFDFAKGACLGAVVQFQRLNGQAVEFFP
jgi:DNA-binding beta-propeller fold protein YncE